MSVIQAIDMFSLLAAFLLWLCCLCLGSLHTPLPCIINHSSNLSTGKHSALSFPGSHHPQSGPSAQHRRSLQVPHVPLTESPILITHMLHPAQHRWGASAGDWLFPWYVCVWVWGAEKSERGCCDFSKRGPLSSPIRTGAEVRASASRVNSQQLRKNLPHTVF